MKTPLICAVTAISVFLGACNENVTTRYYGSKTTIELPCGHKFVNASWKDDSLWYSYRPAEWSDGFRTVTVQERSLFGVLEGRINFIEKDCKWKDSDRLHQD